LSSQIQLRREKQFYVLSSSFTRHVLYYTTYAVVLYKGMPLVHHILLKIRNIMGPAEILLCVLLHFTRIRSFEVGVHSKQDALQGGSERN